MKHFLRLFLGKVLPATLRRRLGLLKNSAEATLCKLPVLGHAHWSSKVKDKESTPFQVNIEVTSICNAKCIMCPRHLMDRKMQVMPWDLFTKVIQESKEMGVSRFALNGYGEIFTAKKDYKKYITYLYDHIPHARVIINSNGSLLDDEAARFIIEKGIDTVHCDIDGATKETFEIVREKLNFDDVVKNIRNLVKVRNELGKSFPKVRVGMIAQKENQHELQDHHDMWTGIADYVQSDYMVSRAGTIETFHGNIDMDRPCSLIWFEMNIYTNGEVVLCCDDWNNKEVMGNILNETIKDVWTGTKFNAYRLKHQEGKACQISLCAKCDYARPGPDWFQARRYDSAS